MNIEFRRVSTPFLDSIKAEQAAKMADADRSITLNSRRYVWKEARHAPGQIGKDGGFWMLEPGDYSHITEGVPLTLNVQDMATALINAGVPKTYVDRGVNPSKPILETLGDILAKAEERHATETGPWFVQSETETELTDRDYGDETDELEDAPEAPYSIGDVVMLRSGGVYMTVEDVDFCPTCGECTIDVVWMNDGGDWYEIAGLDARTVDPINVAPY